MTTTPPPSAPPPMPPGHRYVPPRPGAGFIIGMVLSSLALMLVLLTVLGGAYGASGGGALASVVLAVLPVPLVVGAVLAVDRLEPEPLPELAFAFLWGAGTAVVFAGTANAVGASFIMGFAPSPSSVEYLTAALVAPVTEEVLKGLVLVGYLRYRHHHLDSVTDGIIYAAMVALGFAMTENATYYADAVATDGSGGLVTVFVLRGLFTPLAHPLFTAMTGIGIALAAARADRRWAPWAGLAAAMLLHGVWNGLAGVAGLGGLGVAYVTLFAVLVTVLVVLRRDHAALVESIRTELAPYVASGVLDPAEIDTLASLSHRRAVRRQLQSAHGTPGRDAARRFQRAATDLALLHRRVAAGSHGRSGLDEAEAERQHLVAELTAARAAVTARR